MPNKSNVVENNKTYTGYDLLAGVQWCTPGILECSACISATANPDKSVTLAISLNTPFGSPSKSFTVANNTTFSWSYSKLELRVTISNFTDNGQSLNFDVTLGLCVHLFGTHCASYTHSFSIPENNLLADENISDEKFAALLAIHALSNVKSCNCH
ncbi:MAG TPA: hypothetical protein VEB42_04120 [Chitinophagaceae bacterium]|nr:hypothetical protein [Chitinophagaceae bacterium]